MSIKGLSEWLEPLDALPLECDGMARVVSILLRREGIDHQVQIGSLEIEDVGHIQLHFWIALDDHYIFDIRARIWLGDHENVPHGLFQANAAQQYLVREQVHMDTSDALMFLILTGKSLEDYPTLSSCHNN